MHPHVKKLLELQKVDQEISSLTRDIDALPAEEQKRRKRLDDLERTMTERRMRLQKTELEHQRERVFAALRQHLVLGSSLDTPPRTGGPPPR